VDVFGFGPGQLTRDDDGTVIHGEVHAGDGVIWLHPEAPDFRSGIAEDARGRLGMHRGDGR
jgi:hypothetical protein